MKCILAAFVVFAFVASAGMPSWLTPYPGATVENENASDLAYSAKAKPEEVIAHYRKLLAGAALPFVPNFDGMGTSIRAAAPECDLLIRIRESDEGTLARVNCATRTAGSTTSLYGTDVGIAGSPAPEPPPPDKDKEKEKADGAADVQKPASDAAPDSKKADPPAKAPVPPPVPQSSQLN